MKKIKDVCKKNNLKYHLDGARIWNAVVKKNQDFSEYGSLFDTISVCLSKGLGGPVGSLLLCSEEDFQEAIRIRKVFGGGMRQSGYLAACGIYALENNIQRLSDDHQRAKEIETVLKGLDFINKVEEVETNIIIFEIHEKFSSENFINHLSKQGVKLIGMGDNKLRLVTHMDYTQNHHDYFLDLLRNVTL